MVETPTGRIRHRAYVPLFSLGPPLFVLQLEVDFEAGPDDFRGFPTHMAGRRWRDATAEDLTTLENTDGNERESKSK